MRLYNFEPIISLLFEELCKDGKYIDFQLDVWSAVFYLIWHLVKSRETGGNWFVVKRW